MTQAQGGLISFWDVRVLSPTADTTQHRTLDIPPAHLPHPRGSPRPLCQQQQRIAQHSRPSAERRTVSYSGGRELARAPSRYRWYWTKHSQRIARNPLNRQRSPCPAAPCERCHYLHLPDQTSLSSQTSPISLHHLRGSIQALRANHTQICLDQLPGNYNHRQIPIRPTLTDSSSTIRSLVRVNDQQPSALNRLTTIPRPAPATSPNSPPPFPLPLDKASRYKLSTEAPCGTFPHYF